MKTSPEIAAVQRYKVASWSSGYFNINATGEVEVCHPQGATSLSSLVERIRSQGLQLPLLVRFPHILHERVAHSVQAFHKAITQLNYQGRFQPVYPIKVNQQRRVIEELIQGQLSACDGHIGLEAGSKPELLAVMAEAHRGKTTIVCNGYKDKEFIHLALQAQRLGHRVFLVVEKASELAWILQLAKAMNLKPQLGVRARLASIGQGHWQNTGGEKSKFGLTASEILHLIEVLKEAKQLDAFQLLHFHLGSQIANLRDIQAGLEECARFYVELRRLGAPIKVVDVGGGLGVDYEGTASRSACSMNYSLEQYAQQVVFAFHRASEAAAEPQPDILTESGRALTAHHAVLIADVIEVEEHPDNPVQEPLACKVAALADLWSCYQDAFQHQRSLTELYHDGQHYLQSCHQAYIQGQLNLAERAAAEDITKHLNLVIQQQLNPANSKHRPLLDELNEKLAHRLFVNFSLFQSLPDVWGIDQIFPILPLTGLDQPLHKRGIIQDITCDSDGRIQQYVNGEGIENTLPIPDWSDEQPLIGFFMVGAYQEILGDLHNLFGDTNSLDVVFDEQGKAILQHLKAGDSIEKVLHLVDFDHQKLLENFSKSLSQSHLNPHEQQEVLMQYSQSLNQMTYLQADKATV